MNLYNQVCTNWRKVETALRRHQRLHCREHYYTERGRKRKAAHEKAARFLYLNRVCWNGLYRVNLRGEFNVPLGTKSSVVLDTDDFEAASSLLERASLQTSDFEPIIAEAGEKDFVFVDPPYVTRHNFNGFAKYNETIFSWNDQIRLAASIKKAARRGAMILLTNANHTSIRDLYVDVGMPHRILRHSVLAASSSQRGQTSELALTINYEPKE